MQFMQQLVAPVRCVHYRNTCGQEQSRIAFTTREVRCLGEFVRAPAGRERVLEERFELSSMLCGVEVLRRSFFEQWQLCALRYGLLVLGVEHFAEGAEDLFELLVIVRFGMGPQPPINQL